MQVSADGTIKFVARSSGKTREGAEFHTMTLLDEKGETLRFFCSPEMAGKASMLGFGDDLTPVFDLYTGRNGVTVRITDFIKPSR